MFITTGVFNMFLNRKFILASNSLSRYRLLKNAGLSFIKMKPRCNEKIVRKKLNKKNINIKNYPKILAKEKAMSVSRLRPNYLVVGSDTTIVFEKKIANYTLYHEMDFWCTLIGCFLIITAARSKNT